MGGLRKFLVAAALASAAPAGAASPPLDPLTLDFATCAGRLSALMEHQWLLGDPASDTTEAHRAAMVELLDAVMPLGAEATVLSHRLFAKSAMAKLLARAERDVSSGSRHWARSRAEAEIAACEGLMLG